MSGAELYIAAVGEAESFVLELSESSPSIPWRRVNLTGATLVSLFRRPLGGGATLAIDTAGVAPAARLTIENAQSGELRLHPGSTYWASAGRWHCWFEITIGGIVYRCPRVGNRTIKCNAA